MIMLHGKNKYADESAYPQTDQHLYCLLSEKIYFNFIGPEKDGLCT